MADDANSSSDASSSPAPQPATTTASPSATSVPPSTSSPPPAPSTTQGPPSTTSSPAPTVVTAAPAPASPSSSSQSQLVAPTSPIPPSDSSGGGGQNSPSYVTTAGDHSSPQFNTDLQGGATASISNDNHSAPKATPSTWITVVDATPTVMTFSGITTVDGSTFEAAWAVTTSVGGHSITVTSLIPGSTAGSDNSGPTPFPTVNRLGLIIGCITGAIFFTFFTLFMCKVYRRRRSIQNQEREMVDSWLTRPFSRAARDRYRDMDLNIEVHTTTERIQDPLPLHYQRKPSFRLLSPLIPLSPISMSAFRSPFSSTRRKRGHRLVDLGSISVPVEPVTVQSDSATIRSTLQPSQGKVPFLDLDNEKIDIRNYTASPNLSTLTGIMEERGHQYHSLQRTTTTEDGIHYVPSSVDTHSSLSHYSESPFADFSIMVGPLADGSSGRNRVSMESRVRNFSTTRSRDSIPPDSLLLGGSSPPVQPTSFSTFINDTRGE